MENNFEIKKEKEHDEIENKKDISKFKQDMANKIKKTLNDLYYKIENIEKGSKEWIISVNEIYENLIHLSYFKGMKHTLLFEFKNNEMSEDIDYIKTMIKIITENPESASEEGYKNIINKTLYNIDLM